MVQAFPVVDSMPRVPVGGDGGFGSGVCSEAEAGSGGDLFDALLFGGEAGCSGEGGEKGLDGLSVPPSEQRSGFSPPCSEEASEPKADVCAEQVVTVLERVLTTLADNGEESADVEVGEAVGLFFPFIEAGASVTLEDGEGEELLSTLASSLEALTDIAEEAQTEPLSEEDTEAFTEAVAELLALLQLVSVALRDNEAPRGDAVSGEGRAYLAGGNGIGMFDALSRETEDSDVGAVVETEETGASTEFSEAQAEMLALLEACEENAQELIDAVEGMLDVSATQEQTAVVDGDGVSVSDTLDKITQALDDVLEEHGLSWETRAMEDGKMAYCVAKTVSDESSTETVPDFSAIEPLQSLGFKKVSSPHKGGGAEASETRGTAAASSTEGRETVVDTTTTTRASSGSESQERSFQNGSNMAGQSFGNESASWNSNVAATNGGASFAAAMSAFKSASSTTGESASPVDQVILQMNRNVKSGQNQMTLQLHPADLGKISVTLNFDTDGKVQGSVVAENPRTLEMLQKDSRSLERALQDAGLRAEPGSLDFSLGGQDSRGGKGQSFSEQGSSAKDSGTLSAWDEDEGDAVVSEIQSERYVLTSSGVNIRV